MVIKHKDQRVGVFIDAQNLYHSAKNLYHRKVNFGEVLKMAVGDRKLIRAVAYVIASDSEEEKGFFDALVKSGIETKIKDLQVFSDGAKKADWDVGLAIDCVKMAAKLDTIIIMSGDGDFIPAIDYLRTSFGCQIEVVSFGRSSSGRLKEATDLFVDLDLDPYPYLIAPRGNADDRAPLADRTSNGASAPANGDSKNPADARGASRFPRRRGRGFGRRGPGKPAAGKTDETPSAAAKQ
jgi:uncharacterized LabA/DUF88 family protein